MNVQVAQGRLFAPGNAADVTTAAIVNEAFINEFGLKDPIGKNSPAPSISRSLAW